MRISNLTLLTLALAVLTGCSGLQPGKRQEPNVLLIVMDAARADNFSCYGHDRPTTPNIDRLAGGGLRFTRAVSSSSWTLPAHASLFTGLLPYENGAHSRHGWLVDRIPTLAELLTRRGYRTAAFSNNPHVDRAQNFHRGFGEFHAVWADTAVCSELEPYNTPHTNKLLLEFIGSDPAPDEPFFAFVNYMDTHMPYFPPEPHLSRFLPPGRPADARLDSLCRYNELLNDGTLQPTDEEIAAVWAVYDGALSYLDSEIGKVLEHLENTGLLHNTLVIVLSDHGEVYGEYGFYTHGVLLHRPLIQIPLILHHPGLIPEPAVRDELVSITDIFHTLTALLDIRPPLPEGVTARNLLARRIAEAPCYSRIYTGRADIEGGRRHDTRSVWTPDDRHYILCEGEFSRCFDLKLDFDELHDLCPSQVSPAEVKNVVQKFESRLRRFEETDRDLEIRDDMAPDPQRAAALRALGYAGGGTADEDGEAMHPHAREHLNAGVFHFLRNDPGQAEIELRRAMTMSPGSVSARTYLGFTLYSLGKFEESARVLRSVLGRGDREYLVRAVLAECYARLGRRAEAREQLEGILELELSPEERDRIEQQLDAM